MTDAIEIRPTGPAHGSIRPPGSKSITNRALICAALAEGDSVLTGVLECDDTKVMIEALAKLGISIDHDRDAATVRMIGCGGRFPADEADLYVGNSGTTVRFLTAMLTLGHGVFRLDGTARMRQRPIQDLLDALGQLGANAVSETQSGCPPVVVRGSGLSGGAAIVGGDTSSQYLSGLLMAAPCARDRIELTVAGKLVSKPYIEMTLAVMSAFGVAFEVHDLRRFVSHGKEKAADGSTSSAPPQPSFLHSTICVIPGRQVYQGQNYPIEPDASAASYFFAAAAVTGGEVTVEGLSRESLQGDVAFCNCLANMGCEVRYGADSITVIGRPMRGITVDMNAISDTVQTLGAVALFAEGPTTITGVAHIRHKETDRLAAPAAELRKLGADVELLEDGLRIVPGVLRGAEIDTYDDHRMAMSMAVAGLVQPGVVIRDPGCTAKTYPGFFDDLAKISKTSLP